MVSSVQEKIEAIFNSKRFNLIALGIIATIVLVAYSNTFKAEFHFDDNPSIVDNYLIKQVTMDNIITLLHGVRPVVYLSIMLNYKLNGLNVVGYHIFNILVHICNSFFIYLLLSHTLSMPVLKTKFGGKAKRMSLFAALLFAVHPVQTEAVTYIISRTELLATFFYLSAFLFFITAVQKGKPFYYAGVFLSALLSMSSKEWAVTLPAMLMLYDYLFMADKSIKTVMSRWPAYVLAAIPWCVIYYNLNLINNPSVGFNMTPNATSAVKTPLTYLLTSFNVIWTYIRLLILPINQNLDYEYPIAKTLFEWPTFVSLLGHLAVTGGAFWLYKKRGWIVIPFGVAWFYITLSPVQSFVPIMDLIFEHRVYLPSIGFFIVVVTAYEKLFAGLQVRQTAKKSVPVLSK